MQNNMQAEMVKSDALPTERIAMIAWSFAHGNSYTVAEVAALTGLSWIGAYTLLCKISRILPIYNEDGVWKSL